MSNLDKYNEMRRKAWVSRCGLTFFCRNDLKEHQRNCVDCKHLKKTNNQFTKAEELGLEKPKVSELTRKKLALAGSKRRASEETKKKISASMKKAHAEGRAHNIGECRWNNEPSYPEKWFIKVLKNEFGFEKDKDYKTEYFFHKQFLDFAWPERKLCIEVDGQQHERFPERKLNDAKKDKNLKAENWKLLRIKWSDIYNNTQECIQQILSFLK